MAERVVPEGQRRRRRPTGQGVVLSQRLIVETALRLVSQHGAEALSVRRLGAALGCDPSSVYRYFRSSDDLLLAVADELIGRAVQGWEPTGDWRTDLRALGLRVHGGPHPLTLTLRSDRAASRKEDPHLRYLPNLPHLPEVRPVRRGRPGRGPLADLHQCAGRQPRPPRHYVALGDSYASGAGLRGQSGGLCMRSDQNYGHLAAALQVGTYTDVTCSGAKAKALTEPQYEGLPWGATAQLDAVTADTDLVTIGMGGNDLGAGALGLVELIGVCLVGALVNPNGTPCKDVFHHGHWNWSTGTWEYGSDDLADRIAATAPQLAEALQRVHAKAPNARVLLAGYPSVMPADGSTCAGKQPITPGDAGYLYETLGKLNAMLKATAAANGATYVDTATPTAGHDICSAVPWIEGTQPATQAGPFHPNATGRKVMAGAVSAALR